MLKKEENGQNLGPLGTVLDADGDFLTQLSERDCPDSDSSSHGSEYLEDSMICIEKPQDPLLLFLIHMLEHSSADLAVADHADLAALDINELESAAKFTEALNALKPPLLSTDGVVHLDMAALNSRNQLKPENKDLLDKAPLLSLNASYQSLNDSLGCRPAKAERYPYSKAYSPSVAPQSVKYEYGIYPSTRRIDSSSSHHTYYPAADQQASEWDRRSRFHLHDDYHDEGYYSRSSSAMLPALPRFKTFTQGKLTSHNRYASPPDEPEEDDADLYLLGDATMPVPSDALEKKKQGNGYTMYFWYRDGQRKSSEESNARWRSLLLKPNQTGMRAGSCGCRNTDDPACLSRPGSLLHSHLGPFALVRVGTQARVRRSGLGVQSVPRMVLYRTFKVAVKLLIKHCVVPGWTNIGLTRVNRITYSVIIAICVMLWTLDLSLGSTIVLAKALWRGARIRSETALRTTIHAIDDNTRAYLIDLPPPCPYPKRVFGYGIGYGRCYAYAQCIMRIISPGFTYANVVVCHIATPPSTPKIPLSHYLG
ncbi:hypothetical protein M422DRAFT_251112 [Sphaerobolus stellatus SS14]|uniref:Uncharacterized protein n=1 Tax=Sphaerobolus stellatus (strain SS14) TaxID=990650 RepID=A0A0C9W1D9_SPHS4|nr:hypothetical protein M422DRAFT_251112 [Sphaerobolus stellatus SS14]